MDNDIIKQIGDMGGLFNLPKISLLLMGLLFLVLINNAVRTLSQRLMDRLPSKRFLILQLATLFSFVWYIGGVFSLLAGVIQPPKELLLATGGSMAVAVGIALKDVVASVIAGVILLFDRPFQVGDRVSFADTYGEIVSIGLRSVRLNTLDDNLVTIPNARFITEVVASGNAGALDMMVVTDFHLALDEDIEKARDIVFNVIVTSRFAYLRKDVTFSLEEVAVAERLAIRLRAKAYVLDVRYEKAFQSDVVIRVSRLFREQGIRRPLQNVYSVIDLPVTSPEDHSTDMSAKRPAQ
jgi:small conductance mechanosensitive channel